MDQARYETDRLAHLIASINDWLWEVDENGRYTYSSPQIESILGYTPDEVLGLTPFDLMPTGEREKVASEFSRILAKRESFNFLKNFNLHKNGQLVLLETSGSPFYDENGSFAGYRGIDRDITARNDNRNDIDRYKALLNSLNEPALICLTDGVITFVNHAFLSLFGYTFKELIGKNVSILNPPSANSDQQTAYSLAKIEENHSLELVRQRMKKNGELINVLIKGTTVPDNNGKASFIVGTYQDLTSLDFGNLQLAKMSRDAKLLSQAQSIAHIGGWELDLVTGTLFWTDETYRIHDTSPDQFNPTVDAGIGAYLPESRKILIKALDAATTKGEGYDLLLDLITMKGRKIHVRTSCEVTLADGKPVKLTGAFQDITPIVEKDRFLLLSLAENELAITAAELGVWVLDVDENKLEWNDVQLTLFGIARKDFHGEPAYLTELVHPEDKELYSRQLGKVRQGKLVTNEKFRIIRNDGAMRIISTAMTSISDTNEKISKLIGVNRDITEIEAAKLKIKNHMAELKKSLLGTIELAMKLNDLQDPYTAGHEYRVGVIAGKIASTMGLAENVIEGLIQTGKLHDIGKFKIPLAILSKPGALSAAEFELIKEHPQTGYDVLKDVEFPWPIAETVWQHHERLDGSGYPRGLKGDEIRLEARILSVADVVEAMSAHRPYRPRLGIEAALEEIKRGRGTVYDAEVVDACLKLFGELQFKIPAAPEYVFNINPQ